MLSGAQNGFFLTNNFSFLPLFLNLHHTEVRTNIYYLHTQFFFFKPKNKIAGKDWNNKLNIINRFRLWRNKSVISQKQILVWCYMRWPQIGADPPHIILFCDFFRRQMIRHNFRSLLQPELDLTWKILRNRCQSLLSSSIIRSCLKGSACGYRFFFYLAWAGFLFLFFSASCCWIREPYTGWEFLIDFCSCWFFSSCTKQKKKIRGQFLEWEREKKKQKRERMEANFSKHQSNFKAKSASSRSSNNANVRITLFSVSSACSQAAVPWGRSVWAHLSFWACWLKGKNRFSLTKSNFWADHRLFLMNE